MSDDDVDREIESEVRSNPRRPGESDEEWEERREEIRSRVAKRYWRDIEQIRSEFDVDVPEAQQAYRDALGALGMERGQVSREQIIDSLEEIEEAEEEGKIPEAREVWTGDEYVWELQTNQEYEILPEAKAGLRNYAASVSIVRNGITLDSSVVNFSASTADFFPKLHDAMRSYSKPWEQQSQAIFGKGKYEYQFKITEILEMA